MCVLQGARIWVPDPDSVWRAAELLEDFKGQEKVKIQYEEAEVGEPTEMLRLFLKKSLYNSYFWWVGFFNLHPGLSL